MVGHEHYECIPAIYLVEGGGVVKIGYSRAVRNRIKRMEVRFRGWHGELRNCAVFPVEQDDLLRLERACIKALHEQATPLESRREFFAGIKFEDALAIVRPIVEAN